jgi:hypothetical protein
LHADCCAFRLSLMESPVVGDRLFVGSKYQYILAVRFTFLPFHTYASFSQARGDRQGPSPNYGQALTRRLAASLDASTSTCSTYNLYLCSPLLPNLHLHSPSTPSHHANDFNPAVAFGPLTTVAKITCNRHRLQSPLLHRQHGLPTTDTRPRSSVNPRAR